VIAGDDDGVYVVIPAVIAAIVGGVTSALALPHQDRAVR
jgi:hypothetical protein